MDKCPQTAANLAGDPDRDDDVISERNAKRQPSPPGRGPSSPAKRRQSTGDAHAARDPDREATPADASEATATQSLPRDKYLTNN